LTIVLADPSSQQVMNARLPLGSPLPRRIDPESNNEALRDKTPGISNLVYSPVLKNYCFTARIPIIRSGKVVYILNAVINPNSIQELLKKQRVPAGSVVAVFDRHFNVVARNLNHKEWIGKPASPDLLALLKKKETTGFNMTHTLEGFPVYTIYLRSESTGWSAALGIPVASLDKPIATSYTIFGGAILLSAGLGLLAAYMIGRTLINPMRELEDAAISIGEGNTPHMPNTSLPEIRRVAAALEAAHLEREKLLQSEREARLLEQQARIGAENANKAKDEFLAMLGHELRNPLAAISSAWQILDLTGRTIPQQTEAQAKAVIRRQMRHLARLTGDLLDAGRVIMGKIPIDRKPLNFADLIRNVLDALKNTGQLSSHEIGITLAPVWVEGDTTRLDQIVNNLFTNAVKYTPAYGAIAISLEREGNAAVLRVRDNGLGLEPDLLPRVFDLFVQGQRSIDRSQGGLGIGLTLVRRLVELHGGHIEAKSDGPGKGSEFIVRIPAIETAEAPVPQSTESLAQPQDIVIVEDNDDVRNSLRSFLELEGHRVSEASDGATGVETILGRRPAIALIDIGLPVLSGFHVARAVKEQAGRSIFLIAITGYGSTDDRQQGLLAGFDAYLVKPVDFNALRKTIADASSGHTPTAAEA
ncbi:MAG: chemotaxis protein methyltransferase CheR, partial [Paucimonas sp.]|nr:chemotaxis protein methyltransferase CheR [Paucimonas sp.]